MLDYAPSATLPDATRGGSMTPIRKEDLVQSVADALQFISYYHPADYIAPLK